MNTTDKLDYNLPYRKFLDELDRIDHKISDAQINKKVDPLYYNYIPIDESKVIPMLLKMRPWNTYVFLDVGCGSGRVLAMVKYLTGMKVLGIECIADVAKAGMYAYDVPIEIGDAFKIIDRAWMKANKIGVIYTYMPIRDITKMNELHLHLWRSIPIMGHNILRIEMLPKYLGMDWDPITMQMDFQYEWGPA
jgi:hypothetical protein